MATTTNGFLFAWGLNMCGQLGLGDYVDRHEPEHVTAEGKLFMWGANPDCRLVKKLEYYKKSGRTKNFCNP